MFIKKFILRGSYRNYNLLQFFLKNRKNIDNVLLPQGYIPTEVEYFETGEKDSKTIVVTFEETHFLSRLDTKKAIKLLETIIASRNGHNKSLVILKKYSDSYYLEKKKYIKNLRFTENEFIIPSISTTEYTDYEISQKGNMLLKLIQEGYPVPDFCILSAKSYQQNETKRAEILKIAVSNLEKMTGLKLGSYRLPLVFAIRCAMPVQIPGMMPTYLNVGVTLNSFVVLKEIYGKTVASKIYLNNLKTIAQILLEKNNDYMKLPEDNTSEVNKKIRVLYKVINEIDGKLLWDSYYQLNFFIKAARDFYKRNSDLLYTFVKEKRTFPSMILQKMVWTVRGDDSYAGVIYTRHSRTGIGTQIESKRNIFGEDIMTGTIPAEDTEFFDKNEIKDKFPAIYSFYPLFKKLEKKLLAPATIEFGVESGKNSSLFAILQLNSAEMTGRATLLSSVDLYENSVISKERVLELIRPYHLRQIFSERIDDKSFQNLSFFSKGVSILPRSAVTAKAYFSASSALEAKKRGEKVCFIKENFFPADTIVMGEMDAIICIKPIAIHVVTACRGYGIPALINLQNYYVSIEDNKMFNSNGLIIKEGDFVTISSKNKALFIGEAKYNQARFQKFLKGEKVELEENEEIYFKDMAKAYCTYREIVNSIDQRRIVRAADLAKIIRNDLNDKPDVAMDILNKWYDTHKNTYVEEILKSELGSHLEQHILYNLLTIERKIDLFKMLINKSTLSNLKGFTAGSFMLGRFICQSHPVVFWKEMTCKEIAFLLNEFIYFEKYMQVLNEVGESNLNSARKKILTDGLGNINLNPSSVEIFVPLKLASKNWEEITKHLQKENHSETIHLIDLLKNKNYGYFYDYSQPWSISKLIEICKTDNINLPLQEDC